jgi:kinesin family member 3B
MNVMLRLFRRLLAEAEQRRREVEQQLSEREKERQTANQTYASIKEEISDKRARREKLAKKWAKLQRRREEIIDNHQSVREELEEEQREIQKQSKLFQIIVENFVPVEERERLLKQMQLDDEKNIWTLKELSKET